MPNLSSISAIGHLGRDPEQRTVGDKTVVGFSVAVTRKRGEKETTTWLDCSIWNQRAGEATMQYAHKGDAIFVQGELYQDSFVGKDGTQKTSLRVDVDRVQFLGGRSKQDGERPKDKAQVAHAATAADDANSPPF